MAISMSTVQTGTQNRPPRIVLLGVEKIGKSTFGASANAPIFLPIEGEEGVDFLDVPKFPTLKTYAQTIEALTALLAEEHAFKTVVIDSFSALEKLVWAEVVARDTQPKTTNITNACGGFHQGYVVALNYWNKIAALLDELRNTKGMTTIIIGHVIIKSITEPGQDSYDAYEWSIHKKAAELFYRWADVILFANKKITVSEDGKAQEVFNGERLLYTQKEPTHPGGGRGPYGHLPPKLPFKWDAFVGAIKF
jgi:hypothetical protein